MKSPKNALGVEAAILLALLELDHQYREVTNIHARPMRGLLFRKDDKGSVTLIDQRIPAICSQLRSDNDSDEDRQRRQRRIHNAVRSLKRKGLVWHELVKGKEDEYRYYLSNNGSNRAVRVKARLGLVAA